MTKITNILLDLDGVLSDFLTLALQKIEATRDDGTPPLTPASYAVTGKFNIAEVYGMTMEDFWETLEKGDQFWCNMKPFPWASHLVSWLETIAPVTICTSPSLHEACPAQKLKWANKHLGLRSNAMMIGGRKYLMAKPENLLIDDYPKNVDAFKAAGGQAIQVPSNWNTNPLTFEIVRKAIEEGIK